MKILLVTNKTLSNRNSEWIDGGYWNLYLPLLEMGHEVYFYDTVKGDTQDFSTVVDSFRPELIFCCMTGDPNLTPREPWEEIINETQKGNCKTFNWFCDDTWRFERFSSVACEFFHVCSTPEINYIDRFKEIGYKNIILGFWHANIDMYPKSVKKKRDISFCGRLNKDRALCINVLRSNGIEIENFHGLEHKDMLAKLSESRIGINFSKNYNGRPPVLQMKGRMAEVPAANSLLLTEYAPGLEAHFEIDKEIVTFKTADEALKKASFLIKKPKIIEQISNNGHRRFLKDHESKVRLERTLKQIMEL